MKYLDLDNNVKVSCIGIGCMRISGMSARDADTLVHTALDEGINFFDHADIYGGGKSEEIFGKILADQPGLREKMFIQSKCAIHDGLYDFSGKYIKGAVDGILARLRTDHIDSLLLHRPDPLMEPEEVGEAFDELERSGKVLHFGVSNMNRYQMELLASGVRQKLWANQLQMSLAHSPLINEEHAVRGRSDARRGDAGILPAEQDCGADLVAPAEGVLRRGVPGRQRVRGTEPGARGAGPQVRCDSGRDRVRMAAALSGQDAGGPGNDESGAGKERGGGGRHCAD